jgi:integrase
MREFAIIKAARLAIANIGTETGPSAKTEADYTRKAIRLIGQGEPDAPLVLALMADTLKASTWFSRKASIQFYARRKIREMLKEQDAIQRRLQETPGNDDLADEWSRIVGRLKPWCDLLAAIPSGFPVPPEKREPRHSKRKDLAGLPEDWPTKILMKQEMYYLPFLTAAVTGCRPEEITKGIEFKIEDGKLTVKIQGAKVTNTAGQPWRKMEWRLPRDGLVNILATQVRQAGGSLTVHLESPKNFSTNVRDTARSIWPQRKTDVRPYSLRHQFAANMKASGASDEDIAKAMGHTTVTTAQYYGTAKQAKGSSVHPDRVEATRAVKTKSGKRYVRAVGGKKGGA